MTSKKKHLLHIVHRYWPYAGGSETYMQRLSEALAKDGYEVSVYTTDAWDIELFWAAEKKRVKKASEKRNGVKIQRFQVRHFPFHTKMMHLLALLPLGLGRVQYQLPSPYIPGLKKALKRNCGFDLIHATPLPYNSLLYQAYVCAARNSVPFVLTPFVHIGEGEESDVARYYLRPLQVELMKRASKVLVQTPTEKKVLLDKGISEDKLAMVGVGIELDDFGGANGQRFRRHRGIKGPIVLHLGSQTFDKGSHHVVEAMKSLWQEGIEANLVLAGPTIDDFKRYWQAQPREVKRRCFCLGFVEDKEKVDLIDACDVLVLPSRSESFGIVYLEAWACRKPVIGAKAGGVLDVVDDGKNGFLIDFGDVEALKSCIASVVTDRALAVELGEAGYLKLVSEYLWKDKYSIVRDVYDKLISNKS